MNPESAAILERLAEAKRECPSCFGMGTARAYDATEDLLSDLHSATDTRGVEISCPSCHGTGKVLRFPTLSKDGGTGPIEHDVLEAVLDCLVQEGNRYCRFQHQPAGNVFCFTAPSLSIASYRQPTEGQGHLEAALRALGKVKVIE